MITRSPIYNVARSLTSSQYEFIEREFGYSKNEKSPGHHPSRR